MSIGVFLFLAYSCVLRSPQVDEGNHFRDGNRDLTASHKVLSTAALPALDIIDASVLASAAAVEFEVTLSKVSGWPVVFHWQSSTGSSGDLTIPEGETAAVVRVPLAGLSLTPPTTFTVTLSVSQESHATLAKDGAATGMVYPVTTPTLAIYDAVLDPDVEISYGTATFNVTLSAVPLSAVSVAWATASGTAVAIPDADQIRDTQYLLGDYGAAGGQLTFDPADPESNLTQQVVVRTNPGSIGGDFFVTLSSDDAPITARRGRAVLPNTLASLISFYTPPANASQGIALTYITLSRPVTHDTVIQWRTVDGTGQSTTDYTAASGTLRYVLGDAETQTIAVALTQRQAGTVAFQIALAAADGTPLGTTPITVVQDGDLPVAEIESAEVTLRRKYSAGRVINEPATIRFPVTLSRAYNQEVLVPWRVSFDGVPYPATPKQFAITAPLEGLVEFAPGEKQKWIELALSTDLPNTHLRDQKFRVQLLVEGLVNATVREPWATGNFKYSDAPNE